MTNEEVVVLTSVVAQLRHAYTHLAAERVTQQKMFAEGLMSPAIKKIERLLNPQGVLPEA